MESTQSTQQHSSSTSSTTTPAALRSNPSNSSGARKLQRQRSRLQMHAPASITVGPVEPASISNWQVPIPLLSPLDVSPVHNNTLGMSETDCSGPVGETDAAAVGMSTSTAVVAASAVASSSSSSGSMWRHPAEPFYYEPLPGRRAPGFAFSNCT